jgi:anthranilate synthase/aminodeoxychorismate synthase-like glutamine amidotransferase
MNMQIVVIDNYDSFTYNLVHALEALGAACTVMRNDGISESALTTCDGIVLGPGPGLPVEAGELMTTIAKYHRHKSMLGICLGHQALGEYFGVRLVQLPRVFHGVETHLLWVGNDRIHSNLPDEMEVGLYHSWALENDLTPELTLLAESKEKVVMAMRHHELPLFGVQFHPESIMTPMGRVLLKNWLDSLHTSAMKTTVGTHPEKRGA